MFFSGLVHATTRDAQGHTIPDGPHITVEFHKSKSRRGRPNYS